MIELTEQDFLESDDLSYDEMLDLAWEIAEEEGRPFDHVMGEFLGGIR